MEQINLTEMELKVLEDITKDNFYECGLDSELWSECFIEEQSQEPKKVRGTISSLIQKKIIHQIEKGKNGIIAFTDFGKEIMEELGYE